MRRSAPILLLIALAATACPLEDSAPTTGATTQLTVFAASSLTAAFTRIGRDFETANPGTTVTFNFGPSDGLAGQIETEGAADVFASASPTWMDQVETNPGISDRGDFAQNRLVIITPPDDPGGIGSLRDLANPGVQLVLAAEGVPVGDYAREALGNAGVAGPAEANVVSNEEDDASVVAKIASGEADAGIVYVSDVSEQVAPTVRTVEIPDESNVVATYPIAAVTGTSNLSEARAFVSYVTGTQGQATLEAYGFLPAPAP